MLGETAKVRCSAGFPERRPVTRLPSPVPFLFTLGLFGALGVGGAPASLHALSGQMRSHRLTRRHWLPALHPQLQSPATSPLGRCKSVSPPRPRPSPPFWVFPTAHPSKASLTLPIPRTSNFPSTLFSYSALWPLQSISPLGSRE